MVMIKTIFAVHFLYYAVSLAGMLLKENLKNGSLMCHWIGLNNSSYSNYIHPYKSQCFYKMSMTVNNYNSVNLWLYQTCMHLLNHFIKYLLAGLLWNIILKTGERNHKKWEKSPQTGKKKNTHKKKGKKILKTWKNAPNKGEKIPQKWGKSPKMG